MAHYKMQSTGKCPLQQCASRTHPACLLSHASTAMTDTGKSLRGKKAVVVFVCGAWCPICCTQLKQVRKEWGQVADDLKVRDGAG